MEQHGGGHGRGACAKSRRASLVALLGIGVAFTVAAMALQTVAPTSSFALGSSALVSRSVRFSPLSHRAGFSTGNLILTESGAELTTDLHDMSQAGGTWLRLNFSRANMQPTRDSISWSQTDRVVNAASARGFKIIGVISYSPVWDRPTGTSWQSPPSQPSNFAAFAAAAAARYASQGVDVWEIWNEPNSAQYWAPRPDPAAYVRLLTATSTAIHAVNPEAVVLSGGLSPMATSPNDIAPLTFMQSLYQDGGGPSIDGVAVHPYSYPYLPTSTSRSNAFAQVPAIRALMASHGDAKKAVWLTEYGAPTGASAHAVSDAVQAQMVQQAFNQIRQWPWVAVLLWYAPRDKADDPTIAADNFGLYGYDFSPKPSFVAYRSAVLGP